MQSAFHKGHVFALAAPTSGALTSRLEACFRLVQLYAPERSGAAASRLEACFHLLKFDATERGAPASRIRPVSLELLLRPSTAVKHVLSFAEGAIVRVPFRALAKGRDSPPVGTTRRSLLPSGSPGNTICFNRKRAAYNLGFTRAEAAPPRRPRLNCETSGPSRPSAQRLRFTLSAGGHIPSFAQGAAEAPGRAVGCDLSGTRSSPCACLPRSRVSRHHPVTMKTAGVAGAITRGASGSSAEGAFAKNNSRLGDSTLSNPRRGNSGKPRAIGMLLAAFLCAPLSANAQAGPSGTLTVQMTVGDELGELARPPGSGGDPNALQTLGFPSCSTSSSGLDFGTATVQPGGGLKASLKSNNGFVTVTCDPAGNPNGAGSFPTSVSVIRGHGAPGTPLLMTLNNTNSTLGVFYTVSSGKTPLVVGNNPNVTATVFLFGGPVGGCVALGETCQDSTSIQLVAKYAGTNFPSGQISAGQYRDTLTILLNF